VLKEPTQEPKVLKVLKDQQVHKEHKELQQVHKEHKEL
jgi:hypothetical protein